MNQTLSVLASLVVSMTLEKCSGGRRNRNCINFDVLNGFTDFNCSIPPRQVNGAKLSSYD